MNFPAFLCFVLLLRLGKFLQHSRYVPWMLKSVAYQKSSVTKNAICRVSLSLKEKLCALEELSWNFRMFYLFSLYAISSLKRFTSFYKMHEKNFMHENLTAADIYKKILFKTTKFECSRHISTFSKFSCRT